MTDYLDSLEHLANKIIKIRQKKGLPIPYATYINSTSELNKNTRGDFIITLIYIYLRNNG